MNAYEPRPDMRHLALLLALLLVFSAVVLGGTEVYAQKATAPYGGGTPLDVILNTRLWTDVPDAKGFVRDTRRSPDELEFQPTRGTEYKRPKVRTKAELRSLQKELEQAGARNRARAK
jgi:hypothetical protein